MVRRRARRNPSVDLPVARRPARRAHVACAVLHRRRPNVARSQRRRSGNQSRLAAAGRVGFGKTLRVVAGDGRRVELDADGHPSQLFWLSVLGVFDLSLAIGLLATAVNPWKLVAWPDSNIRRVAAAVLALTVVVAIGARWAVEQTGPAQLPDDSESVRRLTTMMRQTFPTMGARRPLFRIDAPTWGIGFGLILQMRRLSIPATMDPGVAAAFEPSVTANGEEDVLVTLSDFDRHQRRLTRPGNVTLAESNRRDQLYVDAVSLVDHPEYG
jgi:hypothetical protein